MPQHGAWSRTGEALFLALAVVIYSALATPGLARADSLDVLKTLNCPTDGPLRCGDLSVYRLSSGKSFLREYRGTDKAGKHYFTDRLESGQEVLFVFDAGMEGVTVGSKDYQPNNGITLFGRSANETWNFAYKAFSKGKFWANVTGQCTALGDLKEVQAGTFAANRMVCESLYSYPDGGADRRTDTYWFHVPTYQIIAWTSGLPDDGRNWGAEMIALFPAKR